MESLIADHATADCCNCACASLKKKKRKKDAGREYNKRQMIHSEAVIGYMKFLIDHSAAEEGRLSSWRPCILADCFAHATVAEFKARQR